MRRRSFVAVCQRRYNGTAESRAIPFVPRRWQRGHRFLLARRRPVQNSCQYPFSPQFSLTLSLQPKYKGNNILDKMEVPA